jgi:prefoldin subunit 5
MAKGLILRSAREREGLTADIDAMDRAISSITRNLGELDDVNTSATTIKNGAERILNRTRIMRTRIEAELEILDGELQSLRGQDKA